jgi:hypothetical protein
MGHASLLNDGHESLLPINAFDIKVYNGSPAHACLNEGIYYGAVTPGAGVLPHGSVDWVYIFVSPAVFAPAGYTWKKVCCIEEPATFCGR